MNMPMLTASMSFDEACAAVVAFLKTQVPLGLWMVTRYDGVSQVLLEVDDTAYGVGVGPTMPWEGSLCSRMVAGEGPQIAPDTMSVPAYASAPIAQALPIGAYVGIPIRWEGGELFGVLCGLDPAPQGPDLTAQEPLLNLLGGLLSTILEADHARTQAARELERVELLADTDPLTGLLNRRAWTRFLGLEEARYQRFGGPGAVIVVDLDRLK
ncbi:MAG: sensor domain-containing diguanylate cyclase, partial [Frankiales bacterium]|nr:sensor domain-containing diguanylate cyclase [Frankiales bacterium]